jgi:hypothetical protein
MRSEFKNSGTLSSISAGSLSSCAPAGEQSPALILERDAMWKIEEERSYVNLGERQGQHLGFWATEYFAVKDDGTRVSRRIGITRESPDHVIYQSSEISLDLFADRLDRTGKPTDTYDIAVILPRELTLDRARHIMQDVREALLLLSSVPTRDDDGPVTAVKFDWHFWNKRHPSSPPVLGDDLP